MATWQGAAKRGEEEATYRCPLNTWVQVIRRKRRPAELLRPPPPTSRHSVTSRKSAGSGNGSPASRPPPPSTFSLGGPLQAACSVWQYCAGHFRSFF